MNVRLDTYFKLWFFRYLVGLIAFIFVIWAISPWYAITFNSNHSIEGYLFLLEKNKIPKKGELVAFWPPDNPYYQHTWFVKYVYGVGGDYVEVENRNFYINRRLVGKAKEKTLKGDPLELGPTGKIPEHYFFVATPHMDSYDSRYKDIGWIPEDRIIGRTVRLF